jgi:hypothetical protein|tara:strand:- start:2942 stop:3775 length:834 start_codon:yes stop_codon:yes gene_type:complete
MSNSRFFPYTRELNKQEITFPVQDEGAESIVTSPMNVIIISPRRNAYYTTVTGIQKYGGPIYIIGIHYNNGGKVEAYLGADNIILKPKELLDDIEYGTVESLQVTTYNKIIDDIEGRLRQQQEPQPDEDLMDPEEVQTYRNDIDKAIKHIEEMKSDFHSSLKDRRLYHYGMSVEGECFDGETHQYIGNFHLVKDHPTLIDYIYNNLYKTITLRDQAINDVYTQIALGKAAHDVRDLKGYMMQYGGKSKTKKSKRKHTRNNKYKNKSMKRRTTNGNRK